MSFSETYHAEVLHSRQVRAQRAFFWARIVGLALMITIGATLRADPELRAVLMRAGMDGVTHMANLQGGSGGADARVALPSSSRQSDATPLATSRAPATSTLPTARTKINRPGGSDSLPQDQTDAAAIATQLGRTLAEQHVGQ